LILNRKNAIALSSGDIMLGGRKPALVMGPPSSGRSYTCHGQDCPNQGFNTGGCCNRHVHVNIGNYDFNPTYIITFTICQDPAE
jgi:hypothetical protein